MSTPNIFIPVNQQPADNQQPREVPPAVHATEQFLTRVLQVCVGIGISLLPLLFLFGDVASAAAEKQIALAAIVAVSAALATIVALFKKRIATVSLYIFGLLDGLILWGIISAYANNDWFDSMWGAAGDVLTISATILIGMCIVLPLFLQGSVTAISRVLAVSGLVAFVVLAQVILSLWFDITLLSQLIGGLSLVGSFNDTAIYAGVLVVAGLTSLVMLPLRRFAEAIIVVMMALAFTVLLLINFTLAWYGVLFVSVIAAGYIFLRRILFLNVTLSPIPVFTKGVAVVVLLTSIVGVLYGGAISERMTTAAAIDFIDVRPSFSASLSTVRDVYADQPLVGVGPNRYADAWRLYKADDVNESAYWNTDFKSGHSYMLSLFTTYGLIGGVLLVLFQLHFLWFGLRRLVANVNTEPFLRYLMTISFVSALFLWGMTYVYTPSLTILLLTAVFTGLTYAASAALPDETHTVFNLVTNRVRGFVILVVAVISLVLIGWFTMSLYNTYTATADTIDIETTNNDTLVGQVADERIVALTNLIAVANPETVTQEDLLNVSSAALTAARKAVALDPTNPVHYMRLASVYSILGAIEVTGGYETALETLGTVQEYDPKNPSHYVAEARIHLALQDSEQAQAALTTATDLKFNYSEAIQLQTQIAIVNGEAEAFIAELSEVARLEPGNPVRWYQLGLLYNAVEDRAAAIEALLRAIRLDAQYADARYLLALQYAAEDRVPEALSQLSIVAERNPDNEQLVTLTAALENGEDIDVATESPVLDTASDTAVPSLESAEEGSGAGGPQ